VTVWPIGEAPPACKSTNNAEPGLITAELMIAKLGANWQHHLFKRRRRRYHACRDRRVRYLIPIQKVAVTGANFLWGTRSGGYLGPVGDSYFNSVTQVLYGGQDASAGEPSSLITHHTGEQGHLTHRPAPAVRRYGPPAQLGNRPPGINSATVPPPGSIGLSCLQEATAAPYRQAQRGEPAHQAPPDQQAHRPPGSTGETGPPGSAV